MTAAAVQNWLEKLGYVAEPAVLHLRGETIPETHPYALEIKTLLKPDGAVRAQAVFDVEGVPTVVFVGEDGAPLTTAQLDQTRRRRGERGSDRGGDRVAEGLGMIGPSGTVRVMLASRPVDFRKGMDGLAALVREAMGADPFSGTVYVFRAKRSDRVKLLFWDGSGVVLVAKRLEAGGFCWPQRQDGVVHLTAAQLSALLEGLDWKARASGGLHRILLNDISTQVPLTESQHAKTGSFWGTHRGHRGGHRHPGAT